MDYEKEWKEKEWDRTMSQDDRDLMLKLMGMQQSDRQYFAGLGEQGRQFDEGLALNYEQLGLSKDELEFARQQYNLNRQDKLTQQEFENMMSQASLGLSERGMQLSEKQQDFDKWLKSEYLNLDKAKFTEAIKEQQEDTVPLLFNEMRTAENPEQWLIENSPYLTSSELKALKGYLPKDDDYLNDIIDNYLNDFFDSLIRNKK